MIVYIGQKVYLVVKLNPFLLKKLTKVQYALLSFNQIIFPEE